MTPFKSYVGWEGGFTDTDSIDNPMFLIPVTDIWAMNLQFHKEIRVTTNRFKHKVRTYTERDQQTLKLGIHEAKQMKGQKEPQTFVVSLQSYSLQHIPFLFLPGFFSLFTYSPNANSKLLTSFDLFKYPEKISKMDLEYKKIRLP